MTYSRKMYIRIKNLCLKNPARKTLASSSDDKTVQVWDATDGANPFTYTGHKGAVFAVDWSHDGKYIVSSGDRLDPTVQVWHA